MQELCQWICSPVSITTWISNWDCKLTEQNECQDLTTPYRNPLIVVMCHQLNKKQKVYVWAWTMDPILQKGVVLSKTLNCIWCWGFSSGYLRNVENSFVAITTRSTLYSSVYMNIYICIYSEHINVKLGGFPSQLEASKMENETP